MSRADGDCIFYRLSPSHSYNCHAFFMPAFCPRPRPLLFLFSFTRIPVGFARKRRAAAAGNCHCFIDGMEFAIDGKYEYLIKEKMMPRNATAKPAAKTTKTASHMAAKSSSKQDALAMLKEDHKKVKQMFDAFEKLKDQDDAQESEKQRLVNTACTELTIHAQVEEEIFYPAMRESIDDMDMLDEAEVEHASAKQLITELSAMQPGDDLYDAKFIVLGEYVNHHVEEEENEMFKAAKKAKVDLVALGEQIMERKQALRAELGLTEEDEEDQDDEDTGAKRSAKRKSLH